MQQPQQQQQPFVRPPLRANPEQFKYFVRGVEAILLQWTALLLVNNNRDNVALQTVHDEVLGWYYDEGEVYSDQLESYFDDFFSQTHVLLEDGSPKEVADAIYECYVKCCNNDGSAVENYEQRLEYYRKINPVGQSVYEGEYAANADGGVLKLGNNQEGANQEGEEFEDEDEAYDEVANDNGQQQQQHPNIMQHLAQQQMYQQPVQQQQQQQQSGGVNLMQSDAAPPQTEQQRQDFISFLNSVHSNNSQFFVAPPTEEELRIARAEANPKPKQKKQNYVKDKDGWCTVQSKRR